MLPITLGYIEYLHETHLNALILFHSSMCACDAFPEASIWKSVRSRQALHISAFRALPQLIKSAVYSVTCGVVSTFQSDTGEPSLECESSPIPGECD